VIRKMSGVLPDILARETLRSPVASLSPLTHSKPYAAIRICVTQIGGKGVNVPVQRVAVASPVRERSCSHDTP